MTKEADGVFFQQLITGLSIGSIYALMAVGYSLIYSLLNFTNFAQRRFCFFDFLRKNREDLESAGKIQYNRLNMANYGQYAF